MGLLALFGTMAFVNIMVEVKVVKNTMVLQAEESEPHPRHIEQKIGLEQQMFSVNTAKLSEQQVLEMMQIIEEIRLKGYKETL